jgi:hypothetical protein
MEQAVISGWGQPYTRERGYPEDPSKAAAPTDARLPLPCPMSDVEIRSRLTSLLEVLEHERGALEDIDDASLGETLRAIMHLQAVIAAALEALPRPAGNGRRA